MPNGVIPVVQQYQESKGKIIMTATLELVNNQVSYFYSQKKDSEEMVKLADFLQKNTIIADFYIFLGMQHRGIHHAIFYLN